MLERHRSTLGEIRIITTFQNYSTESTETHIKTRSRLTCHFERNMYRKYNRQMKALRMAARSSLYKKDISSHVHQYQDEIYHPDKEYKFWLMPTCNVIMTLAKYNNI